MAKQPRSKNRSVEDLLRKLEQIPESVKDAIRNELRDQTIAIGVAMKSAAPVESGALRDSVRFQMEPALLRATLRAGGKSTTRKSTRVGSPPYDYAFATEFGNSEVAKQPWFYPTYRRMKKPAQAAIKRAAKRAIEKVAKK